MRKFAFLFVLTAIVLATPVYAQSPIIVNTGVINVQGEGTVAVVPDVARLTIGVETQDSSPLVAQTTNSNIMTNVINAVRTLGIEDSDIQTAHFFMHPMQNWMDGSGEIIGYQVSNSLRITVHDIDTVGAVLAAATEAGANMASSVSLGLLDDTASYNQALALAVADAEDRARTISRALGSNLGTVVNVTEMNMFGFSPSGRAEAFGMPIPMADAGVAPIQGGELTIFASVHVTFEIIP